MRHNLFFLSLLMFSTLTQAQNKSWWKPVPQTSWDIQLQGSIQPSARVAAFDLDLFDVSQSVIDSFKKNKVKVICYFSAGTYENWRKDKSSFPKAVIGKKLPEWEGENWLDVRKLETLRSIMGKRMDLAVTKKCDAVDPDNVDGYTQDSGFKISYADQLLYNKMLAEEAHKRGLAIGLKNNLDQIKELEPHFDFAINEQCHQYKECSLLSPFVLKNKAVFGIEYELATSKFCSSSKRNKFSFIKKKYDLKSYVEFCK
jgi:hypothetical protein